ncbi:MAG: hypothetical protein ABII80_02265 [bacterium]
MLSIEYLRSFRLFGFAIFDFAASYLAVFLLAPLLSKLTGLFGWHPSRLQWLYLVLPLSIVFHLIFRQATPLTELALNPRDGYLLKFLLILMLYLGLRK